MNIPRKKSELEWALFSLSHFKAFSVSRPLITPEQTLLQVYEEYTFSSFATQVMNNWEAVHECKDERDTERLRKRAALAAKSRYMTSSLMMDSMNDFDADAVEVTSPLKRLQRELHLE